MARDVIFKCQYFSAVSDTQVKRLRAAPAELSKFLKKNPGQGLDRYWQAVPYLITGRVTGLKEPLRWLTGGAEVLGRNDAGPIQYLSPDRVARLAEALAGKPPDELGHTQYDETAMDEAGVYPQRWVRDGENYDQLGTIRELYSYVRDFLTARRRGPPASRPAPAACRRRSSGQRRGLRTRSWLGVQPGGPWLRCPPPGGYCRTLRPGT